MKLGQGKLLWVKVNISITLTFDRKDDCCNGHYITRNDIQIKIALSVDNVRILTLRFGIKSTFDGTQTSSNTITLTIRAGLSVCVPMNGNVIK